jgi:alpha-glucosidase
MSDSPVVVAVSIGAEWWRTAVFYQIYPRSFADSNGDGTGDLRGITNHMDYVASLGVDALWLSPFLTSPQVDHGYDVADYRAVDPLFGNLADIDALIAAAHAAGIKVTIDLVPNHTSNEHAWFTAAVVAGRGSAERERYLFRDGRGVDGDEPPNNWRSVFGGPSWTRVAEPDGSAGQWYYHLFAPEQPDLNWRNPEVLAEFESIFAFWLDRGVDGFRIDVSDALIKDASFPDTPDGSPIIPKDDASGVHEIYRALRRVMNRYDGDRMAVVETGAPDDIVALFVRPDEMHLAFSFRFVHAGWNADRLRESIDIAIAAAARVGAPATWVTDNHDTARSVTRYGRDVKISGAYVPGAMDNSADATVDIAQGRRRARAMSLLLLSLPGAAYIYNGQELGLPNVDDLPESVLQDPIWERSGHTERGRDGCRVPLPWNGQDPPYGFSDSATTWLPQPADWASLAVAVQDAEPESMLALYRAALTLRHAEPALRGGVVSWLDLGPGVVAFELTHPDGSPVVVVATAGAEGVQLPAGEVLLASGPVSDGWLGPDASAWLRRP